MSRVSFPSIPVPSIVAFLIPLPPIRTGAVLAAIRNSLRYRETAEPDNLESFVAGFPVNWT